MLVCVCELNVLWLTAVTACLFNRGCWSYIFWVSVHRLQPSPSFPLHQPLLTFPSPWMLSQALGSKVRGRSRRDCSRDRSMGDLQDITGFTRSQGNFKSRNFKPFLKIVILHFSIFCSEYKSLYLCSCFVS